MDSHPEYLDFLAALRRASNTSISFRGILYRACDPTYANTRDLLTGLGSRLHGGRWNGPGTFATIYLSQSVEGAIAETLGLAPLYGLNPAGRLPLTLVAIDARLSRVLDFTDATTRRILGMTLTAMNACDWRSENAAGREALTQALGRAAFELGAHGIIVPSAVRRTIKNLNLFPTNLGRAGRLSIRRSDRLPPPPPAPGVV
jgi:RES domain-containing protein